MPLEHASNEEVARLLERIANLLEAQGGNVHRVRAYRDGASTVRERERSVAGLLLQGGREELRELPRIGESLARIIDRYVRTGRSTLLDQLKGEVDPEGLFTQIPGIGKELAHRIVDQLGIETLEQLEQAAHSSALREVSGFGTKRVEAVRVSLAGMLSRAAQRRRMQREQWREVSAQPSVATLLTVDRSYREQAEVGELRTIAPKRFNPEGKAWLPILQTERGQWEFTALHSNTARAHDLDKTRDWVVIYWDDDGREGQYTIVTEHQGPMAGKRVVRGRESECRHYYLEKA
jgi:putative hydrolase